MHVCVLMAVCMAVCGCVCVSVYSGPYAINNITKAVIYERQLMLISEYSSTFSLCIYQNTSNVSSLPEHISQVKGFLT